MIRGKCLLFLVTVMATLGVGATATHAEILLVAGGAINPTDSEVIVTFEFTKPISLEGTDLKATSSISYTLTDGDGDGEVTLTAVAPNTTLLTASVDDDSMVTHDLGVDAGDDGTFAAPGFGGPFSAANDSAAPTGNYETIDAVVSFALSPHDAVSFSGFVEVIPEPASISLLAIGLVSIFHRMRR